jgi:integrase
MLNSTLGFHIDLRSIGKHMPRERYQRGSLKKVGKRSKVWEGLWHVYVRQPDGNEKRLPRTKVLGPAKMSKNEAQKLLDKLITASTATQQDSTSTLTRYSKFEGVWKRYRDLKKAKWGTATEKVIVSIFEGESEQKVQPSVLSVFGQRPVCEITRDPLQRFLNGLATSGASYSVLKKARTYLAAAFEYGVDERLIETNPARKLDLPTKLLKKKPCRRFYMLNEIANLLAIAPPREHVVLRIFFVCGLGPSELFVLRDDDIETARIRIDQALKEAEKGQDRSGQPGDTKTPESAGYVALSRGLREEIENWLMLRGGRKQYHASVIRAESNLLFPSEAGTPLESVIT